MSLRSRAFKSEALGNGSFSPSASNRKCTDLVQITSYTSTLLYMYSMTSNPKCIMTERKQFNAHIETVKPSKVVFQY